MLNKELLEGLKGKLSEYDSGLETQNDYRRWAAQASALLGYKPSYKASFNSHSAYLNVPNLSSYTIAPQLNAMRSLLERAIAELEVEHLVMPARESSPLSLPEEVTLMWLFTHVPVRLWLMAAGVVGGALTLGITIGGSDFYRSLSPSAVHSAGDVSTSVVLGDKTSKMEVASNKNRESDLSVVTLFISGVGAKVEIKKGPQGVRYAGGEVAATNSEGVVYLPLGQPLVLSISGTGAEVRVQAELMPYIQVKNIATGAHVIEM